MRYLADGPEQPELEGECMDGRLSIVPLTGDSRDQCRDIDDGGGCAHHADSARGHGGLEPASPIGAVGGAGVPAAMGRPGAGGVAGGAVAVDAVWPWEITGWRGGELVSQDVFR